MKYFLFLLILLFCKNSFAQKHDHLWLMGYGGGGQSGPNDSSGISILRFDDLNHYSIENNQTCDLNFWGGNSSMCDSMSNLLFFSNTEKIYNANYTLMDNGNNSNGTNQRQPQGVISLPFPQKQDQYLLLTSEVKYFSTELLYAGFKIYKNTIDMSENNGFGKVVEKKIEIIQDTLEYGQITAVKHANGQDWWILVPESYSNRYYTMLLDSSGLTIVDTQAIGAPFVDGLGQAVFSPNGEKYVRVNGIKTTTPTELYIYDFDRCTGKLSNPIHLQYENWGFGVGCAISPNSRFLYALNASYVFQYDLQAADIAASKTLVAEWDGYVHEIHFSTTFAMAQLAPDGRIYVGTAFSTPFLHVIEHPDRKGIACEVRQRAIHLPNYNNYSVPNFPNFRLGPIDGSACDNLGLDNHPLCNWRWEQEDTLTPLQVTFTDLSAYEPETWHWDFGDGTVSQDTSPVHTYLAGGAYQVCLVVRNQFSADTFCQVVHLGVSATVNPLWQSQVKVFPSPFHERLFVECSQPDGRVFRLFDQMGRLMINIKLSFGTMEIDAGTLPSGVYLWDIIGSAGREKSGKIIKTP